MSKRHQRKVCVVANDKNVSLDKSCASTKHDPGRWHHNCYELFLIFKEFRNNNQHKELIQFLIDNYPTNVKNKTFNFVNTEHLFHSLYAYIPAITNVEKERKQIRLSEECIHKLFVNTINDFKLYSELFDMIIGQKMKETCPCQLLLQRREEIKVYVNTIRDKKFDTKPPKLKKEYIDNIMYKYSLNWKNLLLKKKLSETSDGRGNIVGIGKSKNAKKKLKHKKRTILTDDLIYLKNITHSQRLPAINGMSLKVCKHSFITVEKQMRAGDEAVSFIKYCQYCSKIGDNGNQ
ncbi:late expression factor 5 (lef5) [Trichoplusia ni single nucleopolyhedrovirus]|uniref:Late expression factor 5 (Lef5) n=1 Tax=Trichoplusia ni single nucleopolyhedrovirus TaxID=332054 RepID=Q461X9_9ABAC|nr:late expression factor 5 (lef5) [Trichoplusia ni single nucleopolyhedrovirus]AAZ67457.1 late expression factor 5 (lef5) [Trichoplusia ni single nucleopolyhedrovirus]